EEPQEMTEVETETETAPPVPELRRWNPRWLRWAILAAIPSIVVLGVCLYAGTLDFPFQFDDHIYLVGSPFVMEMKEFLIHRTFHDIANHSVSLGLRYDPSVNFILRPVAYFTFHLNYLMNGFNPAGFRAVNIA